jgi:hypothetical protein
MVPLRPRSRAAWITILDIALVACASAAVVVLLGGRTRLNVAGMRLALRTPANLIIVLALAGTARVWLGRGLRALPSIAIPDGTRLEEERVRFMATAARPRAFVPYAAAAALASILWLTPQLLHPRGVPDRGDPVFSAWRLACFTHQLVSDPRHLFDGNIFYPARGTLTFSDATVLQSVAAAPFLLLGADPLLVSNVLLLVTFPLNALAFFYAAWRVTGDLRPAFIAGVLGALYPFHGEHYSHLELEYTFFIPLAVIALLDAIADPRPRRGAWLGVLVAAQWLASMYLGLMLLTFLVPIAVVMGLAWRPRPVASLVKAFAPAAAIVVLAFALLGVPYLRAQSARGDRSLALAGAFSAAPREYGHPHGRLLAYQWITREQNRLEREMFPGFAVLGTAAAGASPPLTAVSIASLISGSLAFDWSLGTNGLTYDDLYHWLLPYRGLRVPARFSMFVGTALIVLGAIGSRRIIGAASRVGLGTVAFAALAAFALLDLRLELRLLDYWKTPPGIYASVTPSMVLAEFPWDNAQDYMYFSTRHWARLLNGYSGSFPGAFVDLQKRLDSFPAPDAIDAARAAGATHLTFNCALETRAYRCQPTIEMLNANPSLELVSAGRWENGEVRLYRFR